MPTSSDTRDAVTSGEVTVRYWAGAAEAAGVDEERRSAGRVDELLAAVQTDRPGLARVLSVATILRDGVALRGDEVVAVGDVVEILPPFAGG